MSERMDEDGYLEPVDINRSISTATPAPVDDDGYTEPVDFNRSISTVTPAQVDDAGYTELADINRSRSSNQRDVITQLKSSVRLLKSLTIVLFVFVLVISALLAFALYRTYVPDTPGATSFAMTFDSDRTDQTYYATDLADPGSYSYGLMQNVFCNDVSSVASRVATFKCEVISFRQGSTNSDASIMATIRYDVQFDGQSAEKLFNDILDAIELATQSYPSWSIDRAGAKIIDGQQK